MGHGIKYKRTICEKNSKNNFMWYDHIVQISWIDFELP